MILLLTSVYTLSNKSAFNMHAFEIKGVVIKQGNFICTVYT